MNNYYNIDFSRSSFSGIPPFIDLSKSLILKIILVSHGSKRTNPIYIYSKIVYLPPPNKKENNKLRFFLTFNFFRKL